MIDLTPCHEPPAPEAVAHHARFLEAFRAACEREEVKGTLAETAGGLRLDFEEQETAPAELILDTFLTELARHGVRAGRRLAAPPGLTGAQADAVVRALAVSIRRLRALMIEYNSYLSAGLPWVFRGGDETLRRRGLCIYRYPARAAADVRPAGDAIRITFHPGPLGAITSSGCYIPTQLPGDFTATVSYRILRWAPGPHTASLALFAQDEPSRVRYYALRQTEAGAPDRPFARANLNDVLSPAVPVPVAGASGAFRLTRRGRAIAAGFHDGADWLMLGEVETGEQPGLFVGAKIWSSGVCGGLEAELFDLTIDGEIPAEQRTVLVERPDPRERG